jgi:hypothetical protein
MLPRAPYYYVIVHNNNAKIGNSKLCNILYDNSNSDSYKYISVLPTPPCPQVTSLTTRSIPEDEPLEPMTELLKLLEEVYQLSQIWGKRQGEDKGKDMQ